MVKDPVCGMEIAKEKAAAHKEHEGKTYYFCSASCRDKFTASPQDYTQKEAGEDAHKGHGGCC
ncbi:MAG: YHS domain-containing protein [Gammaproteobacteria bacterium]|nr:YHS domain-containing protein [Gammaproteobacteria bacterium]